MIHSGENVVCGVPVDVERKRIRRINICVKPDGRVHLSVPKWWATLRDGEEFLLSMELGAQDEGSGVVQTLGSAHPLHRGRDRGAARAAHCAECRMDAAALRTGCSVEDPPPQERLGVLPLPQSQHNVQCRACTPFARPCRVRGSSRIDAPQGSKPRPGVLQAHGRTTAGMEAAAARA